jgi:glycosyltransferase involved in cell wall biosynthesis
MNFTFGIVTSTTTNRFIDIIIESIEELQIPNYEIIIVGNISDDTIKKNNVKNISYNDTPMLDIKKNLITKYAKYDNIVFLHDYIYFDPMWYKGFLRFNDECNGDWLVAMCIHKNLDDTRGIDWIGLPNDTKYGNVLFPYNYSNPKGMYVPGNFWVAKKSLMEKYQLNEELKWGEAEDIEWSKRVFGGAIKSTWLRDIIRVPMDLDIDESNTTDKYRMNIHSSIIYLKNKQTPLNFLKEYDTHSGDNSRPNNYNRNDYEYLIKTNR